MVFSKAITTYVPLQHVIKMIYEVFFPLDRYIREWVRGT